MSEPLLQIDGLHRHFATGRHSLRAVDGVSMTLERGEVMGLVGESGSGKSTLGRALVGLTDKTAGSVTFDGTRLPARYRNRDFRRWSRHMQMIFQDPYSSLNPRMTAGEIIAEGLRLHPERLGRREISRAAAAWLERVGLSASHAGRYPHEFSGGQRQRIGIARALCLRPRFVVCDEPISALDVSVQAQIVTLLDALQQEFDLTLLFIAHDLSMVRYVSDRISVMYLGQIAETGPADDVFFEPLHPYTQVLVASNPEPDPDLEAARLRVDVSGEPHGQLDASAGCRFAPRCPRAMPICHERTPELIPVRDLDGQGSRQVACFLYRED